MLPNHRTKKTVALALALALSAITPAAACAKEIGTAPFGAKYTTPPPTTIVRVSTPAGGFDWADAGIGAAGGLALSMLGIGAALVISSHRRVHGSTSPPAPTT
jgi:hypothetical protein